MVILEGSFSFYFLKRYFLLVHIKSIIDDSLVLAFCLLDGEVICIIYVKKLLVLPLATKFDSQLISGSWNITPCLLGLFLGTNYIVLMLYSNPKSPHQVSIIPAMLYLLPGTRASSFPYFFPILCLSVLPFVSLLLYSWKLLSAYHFLSSCKIYCLWAYNLNTVLGIRLFHLHILKTSRWPVYISVSVRSSPYFTRNFSKGGVDHGLKSIF